MNNEAMIIVFLDGLPFFHSELLKEIGEDFLKISETIPELGYSSNQHWTMFAGLLPDDLGYFTDLNKIDGVNTKRYLSYAKPMNAIIRLIQRKVTSNNKFNIPIGLGGLYRNIAKYPLSNSELFANLDPFFSKFTLRTCAPSKEFEMLENLRNAKMTSYEFIALSLTDHYGHLYIGDDDTYKGKVIPLLLSVSDVISKFRSKYGSDSRCVILSDHGMTLSSERVSFLLEDHFGRQSNNRYHYIMDDLIARIWVYDRAIRKEMLSFLEGFDKGIHLKRSDREYYGVSSSQFGDEILILKPPYRFGPNYFGFGLKKWVKSLQPASKVENNTTGLHGYMPYIESQHGLFAYSSDIELPKLIKNREIMDSFRKIAS